MTQSAGLRRETAGASRLSPDEERELVVATEAGDEEACRQLVDAFLPAIGAAARRMDSSGRVPRTDLMQEGVAGLLFAARRYDPSMGTPFWGYATYWVRKAMQELVAEVTRPVALSDHAVRGLARVKAARRDHLLAHGTEATRTELEAATGFTREQLDSLLASDRPPRSFEEPLDPAESSAASFGEIVADPRAEQEYQQVLDRLEIDAVRNLAERLDAREQTVLRGHYGLTGSPRTLNEIGSELGLSAERVRQIENEALEKLRRVASEPTIAGGRAS